MSTFASQRNNNTRRKDEEQTEMRRQSRRPFGVLSSNTPSKASSKKSTKQPLKPILRSVSAPLLPPSPTLKAERPIERTVTAQPQSIFRSVGVSDELEDMWTLKRATPIFDEDDEEDHFESPIKRSRSTYDPSPEERDEQSAARQELSWNCQIREDENGFTLVL